MNEPLPSSLGNNAGYPLAWVVDLDDLGGSGAVKRRGSRDMAPPRAGGDRPSMRRRLAAWRGTSGGNATGVWELGVGAEVVSGHEMGLSGADWLGLDGLRIQTGITDSDLNFSSIPRTSKPTRGAKWAHCRGKKRARCMEAHIAQRQRFAVRLRSRKRGRR